MTIALCLAAILGFQSTQTDEEKAVETFKAYIKALREADHGKMADQIHSKSLAKIRDRIIAGMEKAPPAVMDRFVKTLGFKDLDDLKAAMPRALFAAYMKNLKELGEGAKSLAGAMEGAEAAVVGTLKKDDKVYIIAETTYTLGGESHVTAVLHVAYRDGDAWKLAHRGETNIGK